MGRRTNTATWNEKYNRWQINVQKDGYRRSFYSSAPAGPGREKPTPKPTRGLMTASRPQGSAWKRRTTNIGRSARRT